MNTREHPEIGVRVRHKRVMTEARKQQNRIASRVYRQKKSAILVEEKTKSANPAVTLLKRKLVPKPLKCPTKIPVTDEKILTIPTNPTMLEVSSPNSDIDQTFAPRLYESSPPLEAIQHTPEVQTEISNSNDIFALLSCSYAFLSAMSPTGYSVSLTPDNVALAGSCLESPRITSELGVANAPQSIFPPASDPSISSPAIHAWVTNSHYAMPDPYLNSLRSPHLSLLTAILYNSRSLNIKLESVMTPYFDSPFYRPTTPSDNPSQLLASAQNPSFPAHLQPTLPQILFPHHAYLDLIPFPVLRSRAIAWAATIPAILSPMDLKRDIVDDGLRCWHEMGTGVGNGQPWDMRSWEFTPWFFEKWRILIVG